MELTEDCCNLQVTFASEYMAKGTQVNVISSNDYYVAPPERTGEEAAISTKRAVIWIHDIFGMHPNAKQAADLVARAADAHVIVPDFFHGEVCDRSQGRPAITAFIDRHSYAAHVRADLSTVLSWLKLKGATRVAAFGLCWGGRIALSAGQELDSAFATISAVGSAHPSRLVADDGKTLRVPLCLLPSKGEDAEIMDSIFRDVKANPEIGPHSVHTRFDTMSHGWVGASADFIDPEKLKNANKALNIATDFFKATL
ncbi:hypothetical protein HK100_004624 [Physocladia obscura]|uniref:Dienelactone hydrolase domain-containing protein n=1 Tax=Physocladia obscura TaxID=109957 RepID=A0AAD5XFP9_9FUNG|nr:hypothetical protein HK100_004624 [Physocladia obscura]